jgi:hypothetical protein
MQAWTKYAFHLLIIRHFRKFKIKVKMNWSWKKLYTQVFQIVGQMSTFYEDMTSNIFNLITEYRSSLRSCINKTDFHVNISS